MELRREYMPFSKQLAIGFWLLAFGFWLLAFGFWLLAFGYWLARVIKSDKEVVVVVVCFA
jgi:hypothetical protein